MLFYTEDFEFRQMGYSEVKQLEKGDKVVICVAVDIPYRMEFVNAEVLHPLDDKGLLLTTAGLADTCSVYEVTDR